MVSPVSSKLWMVFRGGYEYVFTDGEAAMLTVTLSTTAITVFHRHNVPRRRIGHARSGMGDRHAPSEWSRRPGRGR